MAAPILSTPAEHILEEISPINVALKESALSEEQLYVQYEIKRTVNEIRAGKWKRIALQFPDHMLVDAPRVFQHLQQDLKNARKNDSSVDLLAKNVANTQMSSADITKTVVEETLCILGDTSYGACCVDEVAAEHTDAEVVVHYGRSCLSPTARLPVIYIYTSNPINVQAVLASLKDLYTDKNEHVCIMGDIPYTHAIPQIAQRLRDDGYNNIFETKLLRDPSSPLPNRTVPSEVESDPETLKRWAVFHLSSPPTSLLLILSLRVKSVHIFPADSGSTSEANHTAEEASTHQLLRRRYALVTRLSSVPVFGILINTLSVSNYMQALQHCQDLIKRAGKKSYVFVVGKVNAAKVANFSEIGGWVVIGCWESSLIESKDFYRPIITPFELEVALTKDDERVWGAEWIGDFSTLLGREKKAVDNDDGQDESEDIEIEGNWQDQSSDDEPPEFDFRTGKYVSHSRPMGAAKQRNESKSVSAGSTEKRNLVSSALIQRAKGDIATINGIVSPGAEYFRSKRTWQGLGSDYEIAYERDADGKIQGATMEEGRGGVAKGYSVGEDKNKT
ncbi:Diphthamide biosynthesis protein 2 [Acrodontium crateriforme]|uniref:2-(3-amino-3-carboxypropyl)histidine synthase subunit 2 n=1 Tax=Acrodontium crateriforme TaxID=150365 RepID=A0AAQ3LYN8_9PEZI|nr:Diphthamide biosynthesis protein 2 [Acrodontium crateriforme]